MVGTSCSGKSTLSKHLLSTFPGHFSRILSLDDHMYKYNESGEMSFDSGNFSQHLYNHKSEVAEAMSNDESIIIDNTHLQNRDVEDVLKLARSYKYHIIVLAPFFDISLSELKRRAIERKEKTGKNIPKNVIERQYETFCNLKNNYLAEKDKYETFGKWLLNYWVKFHNLGNLLTIDMDTSKFFTLDFSDIEEFTRGLITFMRNEIGKDLRDYITNMLRNIRLYLATFKPTGKLSQDLLTFNDYFNGLVRNVHEVYMYHRSLRVNDILMYMLEDMRKLAVEAMTRAYGIDMVLCKKVDEIDLEKLKII